MEAGGTGLTPAVPPLPTVPFQQQQVLMRNQESSGGPDSEAAQCCDCCIVNSGGCARECPCRAANKDCTKCPPGTEGKCHNHPSRLPMPADNVVSAHVDGSSHGNQNPDGATALGVGAVIRLPNGTVQEVCEPFPHQWILSDQPKQGMTNNRAELWAATRAIQEAPRGSTLVV